MHLTLLHATLGCRGTGVPRGTARTTSELRPQDRGWHEGTHYVWYLNLAFSWMHLTMRHRRKINK